MAFAKTIFLMLCLIIAIGHVNSQCGPNEEFTNCGNCDATCRNPNPICTQACRTGCFCRANYVRNNGICIRKDSC